LRDIGFDPNQKVSDFDSSKIPDIVNSFKKAADIIDSPQVQKGWIVCKRKQESEKKDEKPQQQLDHKQKKTKERTTTTKRRRNIKGDIKRRRKRRRKKRGKEEQQQVKEEEKEKQELKEGEPKEDDGLTYEDFIPILYKQNESSLLKEFPSFDSTVDHYFSRFYAQKVEHARSEHESIMDKQLEKVKHDQETRIKGLENEVQKWTHHAELIEQNIDSVEQCIAAINASLSKRLDWEQLNDYIKEERSNGNPLALMIHKLKLEKGQFSVLLYPQFVDDEEQTEAATVVDIDISLSAYANARVYYEKKKKSSRKKRKNCCCCG